MSLLRRIRNTFSRDRTVDDIDRELAFHLAERTDALRAKGLDAASAAREARRQFGNPLVQRERTRDTDISLILDTALRDLRYAGRTLRRSPGFALSVIAILALGIGANTAVFSAVDAVLLRPLPFPDGDRVMRLHQVLPASAETNIAPVRLEDWQRLSTAFTAISGYYLEDVSESSGDIPERVRRAFVAPRFAAIWGVPPLLGRSFTADEHRVGGSAAVIISHGYWQRRFGGDPAVLERTVRIGRGSIPIIGVMPSTFAFPERDVDLWFPVPTDAPYAQSRQNTWYIGIGRLAPGVTVSAASANLNAAQAQLSTQFPQTDALNVVVTPLKDHLVGPARSSLLLLFTAVSVLLLITCVNVAALLLSRAAERQHEVMLRVALGASRRAVVAQLTTETAVLAALGGLVGIAVAAAAAAALRVAAADLPRVGEIAVNGRVLAYAAVTSAAVALLCLLLPAARASRGTLATGLRTSQRTQVGRGHAVQWTLVAIQVTLSVTLLVGAGLLARSVLALSRVEPGFVASGVLTFRVSGDYSETTDFPRLIARIERTLDAVRALPGVTAAASALMLPGVPMEFENTYMLAGSSTPDQAPMIAASRVVSPDYFGTLQIPLVEGERCRQAAFGNQAALMVNRAFRTRYLADHASVVGLEIATANATAGRIAGVVGDARERGMDRPAQPVVYTCFSAPGPTPFFVARVSGDPLQLVPTLRSRLKELEPQRAVYDAALLDTRIATAYAQTRLRTVLLTVFAVTALLLACVGLYGTLSYVVSLRRREIGLRLALGAARHGIVQQFLARVLRIVGAGCAAGLLLALAAGQWLSGMLFGVTATDPLTLAGVTAAVLVVAAAAAAIPAMRAARFDPMQVLREQ